MQVELWSHFKSVLTAAWPLLSYDDKQTCNTVVRWANDQGNKYAGIASMPISQTKSWLKGIRDRHTGQVRTDLTNAITFLTRLNLKPLASYYNTQAGCEYFGFYFYDGACHSVPKRIPAPVFPPSPPLPPLPPPPDPPPPDPGIFSAIDYKADVLMWWTENTGTAIAKDIDRNWGDWYDKLGGFYEYATIIAALDSFTLTTNIALGQATVNFEHIEKWIGTISKLEGDSLVDRLLKVEEGTTGTTQKQIDRLYSFLDITYIKDADIISRTTGGLMDDLMTIQEQWIDQNKQLGQVSTDQVERILNDSYNLQHGTIIDILIRLNNIEEEVGTSIEQITLDLTKPVYDEGEGFEFIIPVSLGVFKTVIATLVDNVWRALDEIIDTFTKPINFLLQNVYEISDPWLERLKEKLGDVGGEYDLESDTVFQEVAATVAATETVVTELPDWWVSVLASRLEGYLTVGIGEKGDPGRPGMPGARGIQGIQGVQGEPGEPGEGVGLAIDDIDRQLKGRLVTGGAIVTDNVTGVIDYNIGKIGEVFTRYDLEVKPITAFLTTDMQSSLTDIVEAFGTPEALIAYLLDVPEGDEEAMLALMQVLISQTMERGVVYE